MIDGPGFVSLIPGVRILDRNEEKKEGEKGSGREQHELGGMMTATCLVV
jgi:hypothetical protein